METLAEMAPIAEKAFLTAHLLLANGGQAERITMDAIESWNPRDSHDSLFRDVVVAATGAPHLEDPKPSATKLQDELNAVLHLPLRLRQAFVLRFLVGMPAQECARLLH